MSVFTAFECKAPKDNTADLIRMLLLAMAQSEPKHRGHDSDEDEPSPRMQIAMQIERESKTPKKTSTELASQFDYWMKGYTGY